MNFRRFLLVMPAAVLLTAVIAWFWLLHTESGAQWVWGKARSAAPDVLDAQSVEGALSSGLQLRDVVFESDTLSITVGSILVAIDLDIFPLSLEVETLLVDSVLIELSQIGEQGDEMPTDFTDLLHNLAVPISVDIRQLQISRGAMVAPWDRRDLSR